MSFFLSVIAKIWQVKLGPAAKICFCVCLDLLRVAKCYVVVKISRVIQQVTFKTDIIRLMNISQ